MSNGILRMGVHLVLCALAGSLLSCSGEVSWSSIRSDIKRRWPEVAQLSTEDLAARLDRGERVLLIDVRSPEEYAVSHLEGALNIADPQHLPAALGDVAEYDEVVLYCSVGWRSSKAVSEMGALPGKPTFNLDGSIFQWANEDRPVVNEKGETPLVHPFDDEWGLLLAEKHRAPL